MTRLAHLMASFNGVNGLSVRDATSAKPLLSLPQEWTENGQAGPGALAPFSSSVPVCLPSPLHVPLCPSWYTNECFRGTNL